MPEFYKTRFAVSEWSPAAALPRTFAIPTTRFGLRGLCSCTVSAALAALLTPAVAPASNVSTRASSRPIMSQPSTGLALKEFQAAPSTPELSKIPNVARPGEPVKALMKISDAPSRLDSIQASGNITFSGGVPVGGWTAITLYPNGAFNFSGHLHVSGLPSYDVGVTWVVTTSDGQPTFSLSKQGRCHGTLESGSRDFDWNESGTNPALAAAWDELSAGYRWRWNAGANIDISSITGAALQAVGAVGTVIALL